MLHIAGEIFTVLGLMMVGFLTVAGLFFFWLSKLDWR